MWGINYNTNANTNPATLRERFSACLPNIQSSDNEAKEMNECMYACEEPTVDSVPCPLPTKQ